MCSQKVRSVDNELILAEQRCAKNGTRLTKKRKQVLAILLNADKAASAYDVIDRYEVEYGEKLPPMSVYRMLDFLVQEHLVHKLKLANKYVACSDIDSESHGASQFLICSQCDRVREVGINPETVADLKRNSQAAGFKVELPQLEIECVCHNCES